MKKKILSLLIAICMVIPMTLSLVACGDDETVDETPAATKQSTMASDNIALSYTSTIYDGTEKEPTVTLKYGEAVVSSDNYTVEYSNNVNVGTATVVVRSKDDSAVLDANLKFETTFEIKEAPIEVSTVEELNAAIMITDENHIITLTKNLEMQKDSAKKVIPVLIFPKTEDMTVKIDLAGFDVNSSFNIRSMSMDKKETTNNSATVVIKNSTKEESVIGCDDNSLDYAMVIRAAHEGIFDINFENVTFQGYWGAIATNGTDSAAAKIVANKCKFVALKETAENGDDAAVAAYLPAGKYIYEFVDCEFTGYGAYYTKSGHHTLKDCIMTATGGKSFEPKYAGSGAAITGSALMIDSCTGNIHSPAAGYSYSLTVDVYGGVYTSASNYAIQEFSTYQETAKRICYSFVYVSAAELNQNENLDTAMNFENTAAISTHIYDDDNDAVCNKCMAKRELPACNLWDGSTAAVPMVENSKLIKISTAEQLAGLAKAVNSGTTFEGYVIKLEKDIDLNNLEWTPIGYGSGNYNEKVLYGYAFKGTFDGDNHTIYNLKITNFNKGGKHTGASSGIALFGQTIGATIQKLKVVNAEVCGNHYVGTIAGWALNTDINRCEVQNASVDCRFKNTDESGDKAGAIVAHLARGNKSSDAASITECVAINCSVMADRDAGQIIGCISNYAVSYQNEATRVIVAWNETGSTPKKSNTNIQNDICGRIANG